MRFRLPAIFRHTPKTPPAPPRVAYPDRSAGVTAAEVHRDYAAYEQAAARDFGREPGPSASLRELDAAAWGQLVDRHEQERAHARSEEWPWWPHMDEHLREIGRDDLAAFPADRNPMPWRGPTPDREPLRSYGPDLDEDPGPDVDDDLFLDDGAQVPPWDVEVPSEEPSQANPRTGAEPVRDHDHDHDVDL